MQLRQLDYRSPCTARLNAVEGRGFYQLPVVTETAIRSF